MDNKAYNSMLFLLVLFSAKTFSQNADTHSQVDKVECGIHDCSLECLADGKRSISYSGARSITTEFMPGGVVRYTVDKGMNGKKTVLVGPNSYICSINKD